MRKETVGRTLHDPEPEPSNPAGETPGTLPEVADAGLRVLIIDDLQAFLTVIELGLKRHGHTVIVARSGYEGLQILETDPVDVIVCDLEMEGMDGWEVGQAVRELCARRGIRKIPFALLSGWDIDDEDPERLTDSGINLVLQKPVEISLLHQSIRKLVDRS